MRRVLTRDHIIWSLTRWGTSPPRASDGFALALTDEDRRLLRSYKIDPD